MSDQLSEARPGNSTTVEASIVPCPLLLPFPWSLRSRYLGEFHSVKSLKWKLKAGPFTAQQPGWVASRERSQPRAWVGGGGLGAGGPLVTAPEEL